MRKLFRVFFLVGFLALYYYALPVMAAQLVPGTVPQLPPLQPLPPDVAPDVSHNIQKESSPTQPSGAPSGRAIQEQFDQTSRTLGKQQAEVVPPIAPARPSRIGGFLIPIFLAGLAGVFAWTYWRHNHASK